MTHIETAPGNPDPRPPVNWRWVIGSGVVGAGLIAVAFWLESDYGWQGVSEETLVSIGTAILLAGVVFLLGRQFLRSVGMYAKQVARQEADARIEEADRAVDLRLDALSERMNEMTRVRDAAHDAAVEGLALPSFETMTAALAAANKLGAPRIGHVAVQGSADPDELGVIFSWGINMGDGRFAEPAHYALSVRPVVYADFLVRGATPWLELEWNNGATADEDETADQLGLRLIERLQESGRWQGPTTLDWQQTLINLKKALDLAIRSRRREAGALWLKGPCRNSSTMTGSSRRPESSVRPETSSTRKTTSRLTPKVRLVGLKPERGARRGCPNGRTGWIRPPGGDSLSAESVPFRSSGVRMGWRRAGSNAARVPQNSERRLPAGMNRLDGHFPPAEGPMRSRSHFSGTQGRSFRAHKGQQAAQEEFAARARWRSCSCLLTRRYESEPLEIVASANRHRTIRPRPILPASLTTDQKVGHSNPSEGAWVRVPSPGLAFLIAD